MITRPSTHYAGSRLGSWNPFSVTFEIGNHIKINQHEKCGPVPNVENLQSWSSPPVPSVDCEQVVTTNFNGRPQCKQTALGSYCEQVVIADFPESSRLVVVNDGPFTLDEVANHFDENHNGVLDRQEVSNLKRTLRQFSPEQGAAAAAAVSASPRDSAGSLSFQSHHAVWNSYFGSAECDGEECININQTIYSYQLNSGDPDDDAAIRPYERYLHLRLIQSVAWQEPIQWIGIPACKELRPTSWFASWFVRLFWLIFYYRCQAFFTSLFTALPREELLDANDIWICKLAGGLVTLCLVCVASSYGLVDIFSESLAVSPIVFQSLFVVMHTLSVDLMDFLMRFEYFLNQLGTEFEVVENFHSNSSRQSPRYEDSSARMIRCPLCRSVSSQNRVIHNVKHDLEQTCCVCLTDPATTCLACGHLCLCLPCFERSCDHAS